MSVEFKWQFTIKENRLFIYLNESVNSIIELAHENAMFHIANKLSEVTTGQFDWGNKTILSPNSARTIQEAIAKANAFKEVESEVRKDLGLD